MPNEYTQIPQNYKNQVNWVFGAYGDAGVTLANGFQKDAIQNAVGARARDKWENWSCDISLVKTAKGTFLVVEDTGTVGLMGDNIPSVEIQRRVDAGETLGAEQRLARFTSMNNSGGNQTGGGLYGVGKVVYTVASNDYHYYFDSLRADGKYVANDNKCGQVHELAYEGDEAAEFILKRTGLQKKTTTGTRIIIVNPKNEIVEAISNGDLIKFIQESWWIIMGRMGADSFISVNNVRVSIPEEIKNTRKKYELPGTEVYKDGYRVKHFGVYIFDDGDNIWKGISYYRKGMKIGSVDIKDVVPQKLRDKYWGYIEVDEQWEEELSKIEDNVHFGVSKGKKATGVYQNLKNYCTERVRRVLVEFGYIKDKEHENEKLKEELNKIAEELQDLFDTLGYEDLGKGSKKPSFTVRWKDVSYPVPNTEKVTANDKINFTIRINSAYLSEKKFKYTLHIINHDTGSVISQIDTGTASIDAGKVFEKSFCHTVTANNSARFSENRIFLRVSVVGSSKEVIKELPFFFDIDKQDNSRREVVLMPYEWQYPSQESHRVNFDEALRNIKYSINNKRNEVLYYRLNVSVHNASERDCPKLEDIASIDGTLLPFEEAIIDTVPDVVFSRSVYEKYLSSGLLELRARLIAAEDCGEYEKGERITFYHSRIYLNCDEKNGKRDAFEPKSIDDPNNPRRSWYNIERGAREICINIGHTAYTSLAEYPEVQHEYIKEQMLKQYVLLYLAEGKFEMFSEQGESFQEMDPIKASERVIERIESVYYKSIA